jgi:hypothetical protein
MAEAAAAAVHVHDLVRQAEDTRRRYGHRRERLVDLDQVEVRDGDAGALGRLRDREGGRQSGVARRYPHRRPRPDDRQRLEPVLLGVIAVGDDDRAAGVVEAGCVPGRDAEPVDLRMQGRQLGELLRRRVAARCSSTSNVRVSPRLPRIGTSMAKISSRSRPSSVAAMARMCEWYAQLSCSSRLTPALTAVFQPTVIDMSMVGASGVAGWLGDSHGSTPAYGPGSFFITVGLCVMLSAPPAVTTRSMPARMLLSPSRPRRDTGAPGGCAPDPGCRSSRGRRRRSATQPPPWSDSPMMMSSTSSAGTLSAERLADRRLGELDTSMSASDPLRASRWRSERRTR